VFELATAAGSGSSVGVEVFVDVVGVVTVVVEAVNVAGGAAAVPPEIVHGSTEEGGGVVFEGVGSAGSTGAIVGEVLGVLVELKIHVFGVFFEAWTDIREAEKVRGGAEVRQASGEGVGGGEVGEGGSVGGGEWRGFGEKEGWF